MTLYWPVFKNQSTIKKEMHLYWERKYVKSFDWVKMLWNDSKLFPFVIRKLILWPKCLKKRKHQTWPFLTPEMLLTRVALGLLLRYAFDENWILLPFYVQNNDLMKVIIFFFLFFCEKVLFKWKGSVYKLIFKEMIVYLLLYFILNGFYRAVLTQEGWEVYRYAFESLKGNQKSLFKQR